MKTWVLAVTILLSSLSVAQTAKVITLTPEEAKEAARLADVLEKAQRAKQDFDEQIRQRHLVVKDDEQHSVCTAVWSKNDNKLRCYRLGWENGFEYSEDYKFIVPVKVFTPPSTYPSLGTYISPLSW